MKDETFFYCKTFFLIRRERSQLNRSHFYMSSNSLKISRVGDHTCRVATAQGKQGIWFLLFPDRENTGNFALTQGKILRHRENIFLWHREKFRHRENS